MSRGVIVLLSCWVLVGAAAVGAELFAIGALCHVYFGRDNLPDLGPFTRFEFPAIGHVYDTNDKPLVELALEYRQITQFADIPMIVREAILATCAAGLFSRRAARRSRNSSCAVCSSSSKPPGKTAISSGASAC